MIFPLPEISGNSYRIKKYDSFLDKAIDIHDSLGKKRHITNGPASFGEVYDQRHIRPFNHLQAFKAVYGNLKPGDNFRPAWKSGSAKEMQELSLIENKISKFKRKLSVKAKVDTGISGEVKPFNFDRPLDFGVIYKNNSANESPLKCYGMISH
jgi:hypothetical protein